MTSKPFTCAALNASGTKCRSLAVEETGYWRCAKHADWYATATRADKERLALIEIEEAVKELGEADVIDLETRRRGYREGRKGVFRMPSRYLFPALGRQNLLKFMPS